MDETRQRVQSFMRELMRTHGLKATAIARRAKIDPATVYRWMKPDGTRAPDLGSLQKVAAAFGVDNPLAPTQGWPTTSPAASRHGAWREPEMVPLQGSAPSLAVDDNPNVHDRELKTRALELDGYLPGDIIRYDMRLIAPRRDDIVIFNRPDGRGGEETLIRKYVPPFFMSRSLDPSFEAPILNDASIKVMGIVILSVRRRRE